MSNSKNLPILLLDEQSLSLAMQEGEFMCRNLTFEEVKTLLDMSPVHDYIIGFQNFDMYTIIFDYIGIKRRDFKYKEIIDMQVNQDAIVFKKYLTPSKTQPIIRNEELDLEAKKILNVYVYCQYVTRTK